VTKQPQQADRVIHEDQLRNFLVNTLTGAFGISIAGIGDIDPEDIYYSQAKRGTTAFHAYASRTPSTRRSSTHRDRPVVTTANAPESKQRTVFQSRR
jgi:hypothetical protein